MYPPTKEAKKKRADSEYNSMIWYCKGHFHRNQYRNDGLACIFHNHILKKPNEKEQQINKLYITNKQKNGKPHI